MKYLGLDVGTKRTGAAFADDSDDILFSLETIQHSSPAELVSTVEKLVQERLIDMVIIGFPLLPSGEQGAQAKLVLNIQHMLENAGISTELLDERYTSQKGVNFDKDAASACEILSIRLQRK